MIASRGYNNPLGTVYRGITANMSTGESGLSYFYDSQLLAHKQSVYNGISGSYINSHCTSGIIGCTKLAFKLPDYIKEERDDLSIMIERNLLSYISTRRLKKSEEIPDKIKNLSKNGLIKLMDFIISPKRDRAIIKVIDDIKEGEKHILISRENVPSKTDNWV